MLKASKERSLSKCSVRKDIQFPWETPGLQKGWLGRSARNLSEGTSLKNRIKSFPNAGKNVPGLCGNGSRTHSKTRPKEKHPSKTSQDLDTSIHEVFYLVLLCKRAALTFCSCSRECAEGWDESRELDLPGTVGHGAGRELCPKNCDCHILKEWSKAISTAVAFWGL